MSSNSWNQTLISAQGDGTALTNSTTATSILPAAAKFTMPANYLKVGDVIRVRASGRISTVVTTPGTLTLDIRSGSSTVIFNGGAMNLNVTAQTNASWWYDAYLTVRAVGTSANVLGTAQWSSRAIVGSAAVAAGGVPSIILPDTAPAVGSNFDSTTSFVIDMFGTWSVANAANSIQVHQFELALLT
jgi:hypothetical protein